MIEENEVNEEINEFDNFCKYHSTQLLASGVPTHFWASLYLKLKNNDFNTRFIITPNDNDNSSDFDEGYIGDNTISDTRESFDDNYNNEINNNKMKWCLYLNEGQILPDDPNEIYLIDHAWTFEMNNKRQHLEMYPNLVDRMASMMCNDEDDDDDDSNNSGNGYDNSRNKEYKIEKVLNSLWKYCQHYSIQISNEYNPELQTPIWYVMDEVGSAITHSDDPNFRLVPFYYFGEGIAYSLLFPIKECFAGEKITRNFVENVAFGTKERLVALLPWKYTNFKNEDFTQVEPEENYFLEGRTLETFPKLESCKQKVIIDKSQTIKVYTDYSILKKGLTAKEFEFVDNEDEADVIWILTHYKNYLELSLKYPHKFINQFPNENIITVKDLLCIVCRRGNEDHHDPDSLETYPKWLPTTYNLKTEIVKFVSYFQNREDKSLNNHWIIKPFNLARGLDTCITNNLLQIVRLPSTGPKIAQKYIENPVLYYRKDLNEKVKFDIRYVIALKSIEPLEVFTYKKFFLRFSNKLFSLDNFDDYEKHFTVMNYMENTNLERIEYDEFINEWNQQYIKYPWTKIEDKIHEILKELFLNATKYEPPIGIGCNPQSRAVYAADIMLSWDTLNNESDDSSNGGSSGNSTLSSIYIQPQLLEINWMPDCERAVDYYPEFFNDIFKLLFLDEYGDNFRSIF